jgi:hypothetical protein
MNKRIEKLFNEAGFHKPEAERLGIEDKFEKFAELIVRECANQCLSDDSMRILNHMGVKGVE